MNPSPHSNQTPTPPFNSLSRRSLDLGGPRRSRQAKTRFKFQISNISNLGFSLLPLAWLWARLLANLRVEWSLNPQYHYGFAVPFLCAWMIYRRSTNPPPALNHTAPGRRSTRSIPEKLVLPLALFSLFLYAPTHLLQVANPEWRLLTWALTLQVLPITLLLLPSALFDLSTLGSRLSALVPRPGFRLSTLGLRLSTLASRLALPSPPFKQPFALNQKPSTLNHLTTLNLFMPLAFFLVAVPWPSALERPVIDSLTQIVTRAAVELLNLSGIPALPHGNLLELPHGLLAIDEACSGIRSLQTTLMLALFFGELFWLRPAARLATVCAGFLLALLFNILRTTSLAAIAAHHGPAAMQRWHDPAGVLLLLASFTTLYLLAYLCRPDKVARPSTMDPLPFAAPELRPRSDVPTQSGDSRPPLGTPKRSNHLRLRSSVRGATSRLARETKHLQLSTVCCVWLLLVDAGTEAWYRAHESNLPPPLTWTFVAPADNPTLEPVQLAERSRRLLRFDHCLSVAWQTETPGPVTIPPIARWQAIFLRWNPRHSAAYLAQAHTPETCVTGAGRHLIASSSLQVGLPNGLVLPFRAYLFQDGPEILHVWHCLALPAALPAPPAMDRLWAVRHGLRNCGQRSLEIALWGVPDDAQADRQFRNLIRQTVQPTPDQ